MNVLVFLKRHRTTVLFGAALAFGALATLAVRGYIAEYLARERALLQPSQDMAEVVVAKRNLDVGEVVSSDSMALRRIPAEYVASSALHPAEFEGFVGARLTVPMRAGEVLVQGAIAGADVATFSSKIRPGIRALTIAVDEINSVSGMLQPGDRIDLLLSVRPPGQGAGQALPEATAPLMQDLLVLATGRQVRPGGDEQRPGRSFTTITVEVSPEEAQRLIVAQRGGKLTAMLRNPEDRSALTKRVLDLPGLLGISGAKPLAMPDPGPEIIVGGRGALRKERSAGSDAAGTPPVSDASHQTSPVTPALSPVVPPVPAPLADAMARSALSPQPKESK